GTVGGGRGWGWARPGARAGPLRRACGARILAQRVGVSGGLTTLTRPALIAESTASTLGVESITENVVPNCASMWLSEVPTNGNPSARASLTAARLKSTRGV